MTITEPAVCPEADHGLMVPVGRDFAFLKGRVVLGTVEWDKAGDHMVAQGYAPNREAFDAMAMLDKLNRLGARIYGMQQEKLLVDYGDVAEQFSGVFRIDDRTANNWSYMIQVGHPRRGSRLLPGTVYHYFGDEDEEHAGPRLTSFDVLCALMDQPNRLLITDVGKLGHESTESDVVKATFDLDNRVVVWDIGEIYRNQRRARAEGVTVI